MVEKGPKTEAGKRVIALDQETVQALLAHRELVGGGAYDRIFTSPGGSRGPSGTLAHNNFARVWKRALAKAELAHLWPEYGGLHFHDLRREAGSRWLDGGVPLQTIRDWLGHANISQTSTYLESTFAGQHEAMRAFEERRAAALQDIANRGGTGRHQNALGAQNANSEPRETTGKHH